MAKPKDTIGCRIEGCGKEVKARKFCNVHYKRLVRNGHPLALKQKGYHVDPNGYVKTRDKSRKNKYIMVHRLVMENHLNRKLTEYENVHHINGDRSDNRIENLELWNTKQPKGQRIKDKVNWAIEILSLYAPELLKD